MGYSLRSGYVSKSGYSFPDGYGVQADAVIPAEYPANPSHVWKLEEVSAAGPFQDIITSDADFDLVVGGAGAFAKVTGVDGEGLLTNTTDIVALLSASDAQLVSSADFSVTFWIKLSAGLDANENFTLYSQQSDGLQGMWFFPSGSGNTLSYNFTDTDFGADGVRPIADDTWANITITYKHSTKNLKVYVDGELDIEKTLTVGFDGTIQYFTMGPSTGLGAASYACDEIGTFERELTLTEVQQVQTNFRPLPR